MDRQTEKTKFVVGLGNPGPRYARTRHNVGWFVLDELRRRWGPHPPREVFGGRAYQHHPMGPDGKPRKVFLFEPLSYMNLSGGPVGAMIAFYKPDLRDVLIVLDDMALPLGKLRARAGGSDGGHNGLKDVLRTVATRGVPRLRIGIGAPGGGMDPTEHVLSNFSDLENDTIQHAVAMAADAVEEWIAFDIRSVMEKYNKKVRDTTCPEGGSEK